MTRPAIHQPQRMHAGASACFWLRLNMLLHTSVERCRHCIATSLVKVCNRGQYLRPRILRCHRRSILSIARVVVRIYSHRCGNIPSETKLVPPLKCSNRRRHRLSSWLANAHLVEEVHPSVYEEAGEAHYQSLQGDHDNSGQESVVARFSLAVVTFFISLLGCSHCYS